MKTTFTSIFMLASLVSMGQITIDSSDIGSIGTQVVNLSDYNVSGISVLPGSSAAQTFDYSNLNFSDIDTLSFLDPVGTPGAGSFSAANLLMTSSSNDELTYILKTQDSVAVDGVYGDVFLGSGVIGALDFDPDFLLAPFPLTYGDVFTKQQVMDSVVADTFTGIFDSLRIKQHVVVLSEIDAFGTLNLPGSSNQVIRQHNYEISNDTLWGLLGILGWQQVEAISDTVESYQFIGKGKSYYLLDVEVDQGGTVMSAEYQAGGSMIASVQYKQNVSCYSGSDGFVQIIAAGGTSPYTFNWSNGQSGSAPINGSLVAGAYTVTVSDVAGTTVSLSYDITQPDSIKIVSTSIAGDDGAGNGLIDIDVTGGSPSYAYNWSTGATTKNVSSLSSGIYTVTVMDNFSCENSKSFEVDDISGMNDLNGKEMVSFYPNPTSGIVNVSAEGNWSMSIYSVDGKLLEVHQGRDETRVELSEALKGLYLIQIELKEQDQVLRSKIMIE